LLLLLLCWCSSLRVWFILDYTCDLVYLIDMFVQLRTGTDDIFLTEIFINSFAVSVYESSLG